MIVVKFDTEALIGKALDLGAAADQIPYALARTLNDAAEHTRSFLIENTWPEHVYVRNQSFLQASLTTKDARATKGDLTVEIYDKLNRANLALHSRGGIRRAQSSFLAIGTTHNVAALRGPRGVPKSQRPRALTNAFRKGDVIYQRVKRSGQERLRLMYVLKPQAQIKKDVPFLEDFANEMRQGILDNLAKNVAKAMATRRR